MAIFVTVAASLALPGRLPAAPFANFKVPAQATDGWTRGATNTTYQEWDVFYQANGLPNYVDADRTDTDPNPDDNVHNWVVSRSNLSPGTPAAFSTYSNLGKPLSDTVPSIAGTMAGTSSVTQTVPGNVAFIIGEGSPGAGNIYSFMAPTAFTVIIWNYGLTSAANTTIWLQLHTDGSVLDMNSVKLVDPSNPNNLLAPLSSELLFDQSDGTSGFGGEIQTRKFAWTVPGNASQYDLQFAASDSSLSLQYLAADTFAAVPEPASIGLLAIAAAGLLARRRTRRPVCLS